MSLLVTYAGYDPDDKPFARRSARAMGYTQEFIDRAKQARSAAAKLELNRQGLIQFRRWGMPEWARQIVSDVAARHDVMTEEISSSSRRHKVVRARNEAMYLVKASKTALSSPQIAAWFNRNHVSILYAIASHSDRTGAPALVGYDVVNSRAGRRQRAAEICALRRQTKLVASKAKD